METTVTVSIANLERLKEAVKNAEEKLSDFKEAVRELEAIELEIKLKAVNV